jgi:hypothetical protein
MIVVSKPFLGVISEVLSPGFSHGILANHSLNNMLVLICWIVSHSHDMTSTGEISKRNVIASQPFCFHSCKMIFNIAQPFGKPFTYEIGEILIFIGLPDGEMNHYVKEVISL